MANGRRRNRLGASAAGLLALVLACVSGCTSDDASAGSADRAGGGGPPVIAPGAPGEQAETLSPEEAREAAEAAEGEPNDADRMFMSMMIDHHEQAVVMTELAGAHASDSAVRRLAERIGGAQQPEIDFMEAWLDGDGGGGGQQSGHEGMAMPGMATEAELDRLRGARGAAFDRLFLELMIAHHEGALVMATDEASQGSSIQVLELAAEMQATQGPEIDRMQTLLDGLP